MFFILTVDNTNTLELSSLDSSIILAFAKVSSSLDISSSKRPWASFAASYSAFSLRSPLSLASAIAFDARGLEHLLNDQASSLAFLSLFRYNMKRYS